MTDLTNFPIAQRWPAKRPDAIQLYSLPTPNGVKVSMDSSGGIKMDHLGETNMDSIHTVGNVTHRIAMTPMAIREGAALAETLFGPSP